MWFRAGTNGGVTQSPATNSYTQAAIHSGKIDWRLPFTSWFSVWTWILLSSSCCLSACFNLGKFAASYANLPLGEQDLMSARPKYSCLNSFSSLSKSCIWRCLFRLCSCCSLLTLTWRCLFVLARSSVGIHYLRMRVFVCYFVCSVCLRALTRRVKNESSKKNGNIERQYFSKGRVPSRIINQNSLFFPWHINIKCQEHDIFTLMTSYVTLCHIYFTNMTCLLGCAFFGGVPR
jgi:hypothetical protein